MKHLYAHRRIFAGEPAIYPVFNRKETLWRRRVNEGVSVFGHSWRGFDGKAEVVTREWVMEGVGLRILFMCLHFQRLAVTAAFA